MKKYISAFIIALSTLTLASCVKKADVEAVSAILPGLQLSSVGMFTTGPYALPPAPSSSTPAPVNTIQFIFGASTTGKSPGAFDVTITYTDKSVTPNVTSTVETLHFNSWSGADVANTPSLGTISYTTVPSQYPNTTVYQGSIILKIPSTSTTYPAGNPFVSGRSYNVVFKASSADAVTSSQTVNTLFTIQ